MVKSLRCCCSGQSDGEGIDESGKDEAESRISTKNEGICARQPTRFRATYLLLCLDHAETLPVQRQDLLLRLCQFLCWWHLEESELSESAVDGVLWMAKWLEQVVY